MPVDIGCCRLSLGEFNATVTEISDHFYTQLLPQCLENVQIGNVLVFIFHFSPSECFKQPFINADFLFFVFFFLLTKKRVK